MRYRKWMALFCLCLLVCGVSSQAQLKNSPRILPSDPLAKALQSSNTYLGKSLRGQIDADALNGVAANATANQPIKIAVVKQLPPSGAAFGSRDRYTQALHRYLHLDQGMLLIITPRGASASTNALSPDEITRILQDNASTLQSDPVAGSRNVVTAIYGGPPTTQEAPTATPQAAPSQDTGSGVGIALAVVVIGVGLVAVFWFNGAMKKSAAKHQAIREAQAPVGRLHEEVVLGISYADNYLDLLPPSPEATAAREARQAAASLLEQASRFMRDINSLENLGRAQVLLEQAREKVTVCRQKIDAATGGTGMAMAVEGTDYKATPATAKGSFGAPVLHGLHPEAIPEKERGACFFCSRPSRLSDLTPVTVVLNGQRRKVLACADDVRIIQQGATPDVRTVAVEGRQVPWYGARQYDPYRDYTRTEVVYTPGYGGYSYGDAFVDGLLFNSLMAEPMMMPYPVFVNNAGDPTDNFQMAAPDYGIPDNTGSIDFGNNNGNGADSTGNVDFGNTEGSDFGNTDFGGSSDSGGGFDSGGSVDFGGGSDSGGSDFGGGGSDS